MTKSKSKKISYDVISVTSSLTSTKNISKITSQDLNIKQESCEYKHFELTTTNHAPNSSLLKNAISANFIACIIIVQNSQIVK